jgi:hypothetical protein
VRHTVRLFAGSEWQIPKRLARFSVRTEISYSRNSFADSRIGDGLGVRQKTQWILFPILRVFNDISIAKVIQR